MRLVIVEDEPMVARRLERLTREVIGATAKIEVAYDLDAATAIVRADAAAVVLLDLNLSGEDGFDLLRRAAAEPFQVIVVSANTDRALEAFDLGVVDFVPKPFTRERLAKAFERARAGRGERRTRRLAIAGTGRVDLIPLDEVVAVRGADDYSEVETADGRTLLYKKTLTALEVMLPAEFVRVHRSHIVHLRYAARLLSHGGGQHELVLTNGRRAPVGRTYLNALRTRLA
jgi:DNA-binding LytR/AlgR family response regulator